MVGENSIGVLLTFIPELSLWTRVVVTVTQRYAWAITRLWVITKVVPRWFVL